VVVGVGTAVFTPTTTLIPRRPIICEQVSFILQEYNSIYHEH